MPERTPEPEISDAAEAAAEAAYMRALDVGDVLVFAENELYDQADERPGCDELLRRGVALPDVEPAPPSTPEQRRQWRRERFADFKPVILPPGLDHWVPGPWDTDLRAEAAKFASAEQLTVRAAAGDGFARAELERRGTAPDAD
jgi:hypothetical protein